MILGVEGSPRRAGNSHYLLELFLSEAQSYAQETSKVHLREMSFSSCIGCEGCRKAKKCVGLNDDMTGVYPLIEAAQGVVLVSPVHNYNVTAWMKAYIDRMYCYYDFEDTLPRAWSSRLSGQNRKAVVIAIAEQESEEDMGFAIEAMSLPLTALGYEVVSEIKVLRTFKAGAISENAGVISEVKKAVGKLVKSLG